MTDDDEKKRKKKEYNKKYRKENRDKINERQRKYREENRERIRETQRKCSRKYRASLTDEQREKENEYKREYYKKNRDRIRAAQKKYCDLNRDKLNEKQRQQYYENREENVKKTKKYYEENREEILEKRKDMPSVQRASQKWMKKTYHGDEIYRLAHLIRSRLYHALEYFLKNGFHQQNRKYKKGEVGYIDYQNIIEYIGDCPGEHGTGRGQYSIDHIIPLRWLQLDDPIDWAIAVHPRNHRWLTNKENYDRQDHLVVSDMELYKELYKEVLMAFSEEGDDEI